MKATCLIDQKCTPCQGGTPPLTEEEMLPLLKQLTPEWQLNPAGHLNRIYRFKNFQQAMAFGQTIGELAEQEGHHPDLGIGWGRCEVEIWTHKIGGLTESDFILAAKIEKLSKK